MANLPICNYRRFYSIKTAKLHKSDPTHLRGMAWYSVTQMAKYKLNPRKMHTVWPEGKGCGSVGIVVVSNTWDPRFKSSLQHILFTINCFGKTKIKKWDRELPTFYKHCDQMARLFRQSLNSHSKEYLSNIKNGQIPIKPTKYGKNLKIRQIWSTVCKLNKIKLFCGQLS